MSRTPQTAALPDGVEVAGPELTAELFDGVDRVFVFPTSAQKVGDLVTAAGKRRFVVFSSLAAAGELSREVRSTSYTHHRAVEQAVTTRTDEWTILRPGTFANNLLSWAWSIKAGRPVRAPYINSAQPPIHEADIADAAATVLLEDGHIGQIYPLTGPETLTRIEQVAAIGTGIGRHIDLVEISPDEFRADVSQFITEDIITMLLEYWSETVTTPDPVRSGVLDVTGGPGRTLEQWARDHRTDFI